MGVSMSEWIIKKLIENETERVRNLSINSKEKKRGAWSLPKNILIKKDDCIEGLVLGGVFC